MNNKKWILPLMMLLVLFFAAPAVSAHVTLHPEESSTDAWEKYSVRVPVEKDMNTTKVELLVPDEVDLVNVMPKEGWDYELEKDDDGNITSVTWEETNGGIGPDEFAEFYIVASNPSEPTDVSWNAYQTYEDDSIVEWDGDSDSDEPAPVVEVMEGDAEPQHGENDASAGDSGESAQTNDEANESASGGTSWLPTTLSIFAILLALISLFRKKA